MSRYPVWKYFLVLFVLALGLLYAAPNLYPPDAAIQISADSGTRLSDDVLKKALKSLDDAGISYKAGDITDRNIVIRLYHQDDQLKAKNHIEHTLEGFVVALNLAPTTPEWLTALGAEPMKLGLDLSGGVHFLLEVDTDFAIAKRLDGYKGEVKKALRENNIRGIVDDKAAILMGQFKTAELRDQAMAVVKDAAPDLSAEKRDDADSFWVDWHLGEALQKRIADEAVSQNLTALRNRVNELGVSEPLVQRQGAKRIVVELPGVQDSSQAKKIIGKTANLEFRLESDGKGSSQSFAFRDKRMGKAELERTVVITGDQVTKASSSFDQNGRPQVNIGLDALGGKKMNVATRDNIGRRLGVLFIERKYRNKNVVGENGEITREKQPYYQKEIISLATIQAPLGVQFRITGLDSVQEAKDLALLLRAGALAAPIDFVEERTIGPSLGAENIRLGMKAVIWGMALVLLFMLVYYKVFGITANLALIMNVVLIVACMSIFSATLTLPGIAGIVLTVGMAVDANVLIFARIREELKQGMSPQQAINAGYERAFVTIMDANITTFLVGIILFAMGSGPVKGFAVTLMIGIVTSMFTAIVGTRALINLIYGNKPVKKLAI